MPKAFYMEYNVIEEDMNTKITQGIALYIKKQQQKNTSIDSIMNSTAFCTNLYK